MREELRFFFGKNGEGASGKGNLRGHFESPASNQIPEVGHSHSNFKFFIKKIYDMQKVFLATLNMLIHIVFSFTHTSNEITKLRKLKYEL